jgi:hypothetical protein
MGLQRSGFYPRKKERQEKDLQELYQRICQQGQIQQMRHWPDLRLHLLLAHFGQFRLCDYDAYIQQLLRSGEVCCSWRQATILEGGERIPSNDDTLVWRH